MPPGLDLRDSAFNLGVARVIIFATLLGSVEQWAPNVAAVASMPPDAWFPPSGARSVFLILPPTPALATLGLWALRVFAVLGLLGLWPRAAAATCAVLSVYVFGIMWCHGGLHHMLHHFPVMLAILAASRCGDALAIGGGVGREERPTRRLAHGLPLRAMGITLGLIYFFPGYWKAATAPAWWFSGEAVRIVSWRDWGLGGPRFTLDDAPALLSAIGVFTVVFELAFLPLVLWRRARPLLAVAGVLFHAGITAMTGIDFWALAACLLVLIDWDAIVRRAPLDREWAAPEGRSQFLPLAAVCAITWSAMCAAGGRDRHMAWPIAAYPTFRGVWPARQATVQGVAVLEGGEERVLGDDAMRRVCGSTWWKVKQHLATADAGDERAARWRRGVLGYWGACEGLPPGTVLLRLYGVVYSTNPRDRGAVVGRQLLIEVAAPAAR